MHFLIIIFLFHAISCLNIEFNPSAGSITTTTTNSGTKIQLKSFFHYKTCFRSSKYQQDEFSDLVKSRSVIKKSIFNDKVKYELDIWQGGVRLKGVETTEGECTDEYLIYNDKGEFSLLCTVTWGVGKCGVASFQVSGKYEKQ